MQCKAYMSMGQKSLHPVMDADMGGCRFLMFPSLDKVEKQSAQDCTRLKV